MSYFLFVLVAAATALTARLIPAMLTGASDEPSSLFTRHPLRILLSTWTFVFAVLITVAA